MFKLRTLVLLPIILFACRPISGELPVETPALNGAEVAVPGNDAGDVSVDSPRLATDAPSAAPGLPPTWTPQPVDSNPVLPQTSDTASDSGANVEQGTAVPAYTGSSTGYVVKRGDTLAEICIEYSVPITEVARINNITDWDHIEIGQVLIIPSED